MLLFLFYKKVKPYYEYVDFLTTMPGITAISATLILSEVGVSKSDTY